MFVEYHGSYDYQEILEDKTATNEFIVNIDNDLGMGNNRLYIAPGYQHSISVNLQSGYMLSGFF